jgi:hypothetical protein
MAENNHGLIFFEDDAYLLPPGDGNLLQEDLTLLLQENGSNILVEGD